jgi:ATP-dependent Lon protease
MAQSDSDDLISLIEDDGAISEIPTSLPLLPVRDVVIFCDMVLPLFVGRDKSIRAVEEGVAKDGFLMLATQKDPAIEDPAADDI